MKIFNRILYIFNMLTLFSLALSYLAPYISPNTFLWPISFLGLIYPILLIVNMLFAIYWMLSFKRYFWSNLIIIIIGYGHIQSLIKFKNNNPQKNSQISIMSYNVRLFNAYEWINNHNIKKEIIDFINIQKPDILCVQEFYAPKNLPEIKLKYSHIGLQTKQKQWRMATYSNFPIIQKGTVSIKGERKNNVCIFSDIITPYDTIRVYNIHLASNWFRESDYLFMKNPPLERTNFTKGIKEIIARLKTAFSKRAEQVDIIKQHIKKSPYPIIICGDFNDTANSYAYRQLSYGLKDSFQEQGKGFGKTYNGKSLTPLRIDYILCSPELNICRFITHDKKLSDHFPIQANIN